MTSFDSKGTQHVVVVGAGLGGLAAAIRLRARGYAVTVVEANEQAGGRASVFSQDGHVFDAGPTVITAPYLIDELFTLAGRDAREYVEMLPVDPWYRVVFPDGAHFDYVGEEERLLSQIEAISPRDVDGYRRFARHAEEVFKVGYEGLADKPFDRFGAMMKIAPDLLKLGGQRTLYSMASSFLHDERLRQVFTFQPLLIGGSPFRAPAIYMLIHWLERKWGVWFPRGGTGALVQALVRLLGDMGVEVRLNTPVTGIDVDNGRVTGVRVGAGEVRIAADAVVANGDPSMIYSRLIAPEHRPTMSDRKVAAVRQSMSLFVSYFGTAKTFPDVVHHTILLGPRYRGLLDDIFAKRKLAEDFSLYLHRPTATDPSLAPPGKESFYVLSPVPNLKGNVDWEKEGARYEDAIWKSLEARAMPGFRASVTTSLRIDPRTFRDRLRSVDGAAFGPEPLLTQSAYFRYHNRSDVRGLFFVGAGTHPGAGVPGVLTSARVLDHVMDAPAQPLPLPAPERRTQAPRAA